MSESKKEYLYYLAGDIGGTNTRLLLVQRPLSLANAPAQEEGEVLIASKIYPSRQYNDLTTIIALFLNEHHIHASRYPSVGALAVAGPVTDNRCNITNLNWFLDGDHMAKILRIPKITLLNDFVAVGYGLLALRPNDLEVLSDHPKVPHAPMAVLGAGTGLGEAYLTWTGHEYEVWPTEGGHASFAARTDVEYKLQKYFRETERLPNVSVERVVSGLAIPKIYDFFCKEHPSLVNKSNDESIRKSKDPAAIIAQHALNDTDALCSQVMDLFVKCYGAEAGDFALKKLPFAGLYVAGGIAPQILPAMKDQNKFIENMVQKGRMRAILERVPVYVVKHTQVGLLGARVVSRRLIRDSMQHTRSKL